MISILKLDISFTDVVYNFPRRSVIFDSLIFLEIEIINKIMIMIIPIKMIYYNIITITILLFKILISSSIKYKYFIRDKFLFFYNNYIMMNHLAASNGKNLSRNFRKLSISDIRLVDKFRICYYKLRKRVYK